MLYFVVGLPGSFTQWCRAVVAGMAGRSMGPAQIVEANTLGEIALTMLRGDFSHAVICAHAPGGKLRSAISAADRPFVIALDDPRLACADLVLGEQSTLPAAVRQVASSCGAIAGFSSAPGALMLWADPGWSDRVTTARALADHFRFAVTDHDIADVLDEVASGGLAPPSGDAEHWWNQLGRIEQEIAVGALGPYVEHSDSAGASRILWSADLFSLDDRPALPANGAIDITGRPRCLLQGPHVVLPPGSWLLALTLGFSRETADHEFLVEILTDRQLASSNLRPHHEGDWTAELSFMIDGSSDHPVAIRLSTRRAAFDGFVTLRGASLLRHPEPGMSDVAGSPPDP